MDRMLTTVDPRFGTDSSSAPDACLKVLSLCLVFPNSAEPGLGLFVRSRLQHLAACSDLKIVAPVPIIDYSGPGGVFKASSLVPPQRWDNGVEVLHPRWIYPPGGTPLNVLCLAIRLVWTLTNLRRRFRFEVIDAHFGYPEGVTGALLALVFRVPLVITLRGSEMMFASYKFRGAALRWAFQRASKVIAVSEELRQFAISHGVDAGKAITIPNGVDRNVFHPRDRRAVRLKHRIPAHRKVIVSAGEMIEAKGHQHVAGALRDLLAEGVDAQLLIVGGSARGGPKYEVALKRFVKSLNVGDRIRFIGWADREGVAELLSAADVFCLASYTEGWPNVVHEALACGTPVVATRVGAIPEMIPSADYGRVTPAKDEASLLIALRSALQTEWDRDQIARWGGARTWNLVATEVLAVFRSIVHGEAPLAEAENVSIPAGGR